MRDTKEAKKDTAGPTHVSLKAAKLIPLMLVQG